MFKNFLWYVVKEFLPSITFAFILFFGSVVFFASSAWAQTTPTCGSSNFRFSGGASACGNPNAFAEAAANCYSREGPHCLKVTSTDSCGVRQWACYGEHPNCPVGQVVNPATGYCEDLSCPEGQIPNTIIDGSGNQITSCIDDTGGQQPVDEPQECGITGFPIWNGSGYDCVEDFDTPCPEGTTNGMYTLPGYDPRPYCADATPPNSSSAGSASSNSGQNSSSNNSDGNGDGEGSGSSSGNTGNSSSASSTGGGGNSSGSASSGQGGSASSASGECDPTAKNYLECLNSKELEIPSEKGSYDDGSGTTTDDRIEELEGELQDVVDQIKSEIDSTVGVNLSGSGTLTDQCYQIMKVQVCFGWARWSQHLALIGNAIIAIAYTASFVIIMRQ